VLPADVAWIRVAGVDLPVSKATGPSDTTGGLARGFAHTPAGAVVAALHLIVRVTPQVGPAVFGPTLAAQVVGEQADALRREVAQAYEDGARAAGVVNAVPLGELPARVAGARVDGYTDASAVVSVLTSVVDPEGTTLYAATAVSLSWVDADWRLVAPDAGRWDEVVRPVDPAAATTFPTIGRR
jgi:hypothetical protein